MIKTKRTSNGIRGYDDDKTVDGENAGRLSVGLVQIIQPPMECSRRRHVQATAVLSLSLLFVAV